MRVRAVVGMIAGSTAVAVTYAVISRNVGLLLIPILAFLFLVTMALIRLSLAGSSPRPEAQTQSDLRPADGVVEVAALTEVEAEPNLIDPRWRRFVADRGGLVARTSLEARPMMLGRVVLLSVFVGRDGKSWTDREIADGHVSLLNAATWIERQAMRFETPLNLEVADTYFATDDDHRGPVEIRFVAEGDGFGPMEAGATRRYLASASQAAAKLGFPDVAAMMRTINAKVGADAHAWIFHQRSKGRSIAIDGHQYGLDGVELAVCFARESSFPEPLVGTARVDPTTVVHEVLHLFGASDKYGVSLRSFAKGSVSSLDIMRLGHDRLSRLTIGRLTASEIGWPVGVDEKTAANR